MSDSMYDANGDSRANRLLVVDYSLLGITLVLVAGRYFSRVQKLGGLGPDDFCILLATLLLVFLVALQTVMTTYGFGHPTASLPAVTFEIQSFIGSIARLVYTPASSLIRISVLLFVRRLSVHSWIHYTTLVLIAANILYAVIPVFLLTFQCWPVSASFQSPIIRRSAKCLNGQMLGLAIPLASLLLDVVVWFVPVILVVRVRNLGWRKKMLSVALLGIGILACGASMMRLPAGRRKGARSDPSRHIIVLAMWTSVELSIGIIAASAPALWPLIVLCTRRCTNWTPSASFWTNAEPRIHGFVDEEMADVVSPEPDRDMRKFDSTEELFDCDVEELAGDDSVS